MMGKRVEEYRRISLPRHPLKAEMLSEKTVIVGGNDDHLGVAGEPLYLF
jgi:hypothetical protein